MIDLSKASFEEMAKEVLAMWNELKRRNPIGVNFYGEYFKLTASVLQEIHEAELVNPTCEEGPGIDDRNQEEETRSR